MDGAGLTAARGVDAGSVVPAPRTDLRGRVYGLSFRAVPGGGLLPDLSAAAGGSPPARYKESASWP